MTIKNLLTTITIIITVSLFSMQNSYAATPTPKSNLTPTASPDANNDQEEAGEKLNQQINQLKERIASRVAELNLVEKKGVIGIVSDTSGNQVTFTDLNQKNRQLDVDEITKFSSPSAKNSFGLSDLVSGTKISVVGLYNKQTQRILARYINFIVTPTRLSGRVANIDKTKFTLTVITQNQEEKEIDIEKITSISNYTQEDGISKYGFSKLKIGDRVIITGYPGKNNPDVLSATRVLILSDLPINPKIIITDPSTTGELTVEEE